MEGTNMQCPKCQFENREGVKFCEECGAEFGLECPVCKANIPLGRKFCGECGHKIDVPIETPPKDLSFDQKIEKIQKYLPKGLTEKILSQRDRIEGERKHVTVMFCDMESFTQLSEKLGAEEAYAIMDQVYEILIHKVHDYEGTVNEMTGDGIMALFGAPIALEGAPQRAIQSSFAIHREMAIFSDKLKQEKNEIPPLKMRIGIHTGMVVVGTLGNDLRVEFKAVGDTVNLASRIEGLAKPGTTYVTEDTFKLTEGLFRFEALGEKKVKGKDGSVKIYQVIAPSNRRSRFDVSTDRGLTPFVARERELELLRDSFKRAKAGRGQAVSIVGDAGVGKSRLLYEFRKAVANENMTFLEGRCLSYSQGVPYHLYTDILKANFDIREGSRDSEIREKVIKGLKILKADEASILPYILELSGVKDSSIDKIPMSPEAKKDRILEALRQIVLKGSELRPLILAYEDLHWMDKNSEDALKYILESIPGARVLLIFAYRTEFVHTWGGRSYHSQITLNRLSNRESLAMVTHILGTEQIDSDLEDLILDKTEGIPFFIEEFIRSLKELEIIEKKDNRYHLIKDPQDLTIPSTIKDVIMTRVDSLPDGAKEVLQAGSVIEREFSHDLIKQVTALPEKKLMSYLSALKDSELLYERGIYPQSTYIFKHALTREVVYDSILTKRKKRFHDDIGNATEELYKENIDEHYGVLSEHYILSDNFEKGAEYSRLAGKQAQLRSSYSDAISYAKKGVFCLERLPQTEATQKSIIDARTALSNYCMGLNYHFEGMQAVAPIVNLAQKINYKKRLPRIYVATGTYNIFVEEDLVKGIEDLIQAKTLSEETGDFLSLWYACYFLGTAHWLECDFEKSSSYYQMSLDLSEAANNNLGIFFAKGTRAVHPYAYNGKIDLAYKTSKESLDLANESGDIYIQQMAYSSFGLCCLMKGLFSEAEIYLLEAINLHRKTKQVAWGQNAYVGLGDLYFNSGDFEKAQYYYNRANLFLENNKLFPSWIKLNKTKLIYAKVLQNNKDIHLESIFEYAKQNKLKCNGGEIANHISGILMNIDDQFFPAAEKWINNAIEADKRTGMIWHLGRDSALYAEYFKRKGDLSKAKENLNKAIEIFSECSADGWVEKYEKELATL
jgi:class 3 adenylate cyclase/tetratricopeptide (TPR) repeat protein